ncbi:hypothetical protein J6590_091546 [Homalodisca vitripennis]|nr:hypothetical protein J6590_091546 [Homalodisca vitripennis]
MGAKFLNLLPETIKGPSINSTRQRLTTWLVERPFYTVEEFMNWRTSPVFQAPFVGRFSDRQCTELLPSSLAVVQQRRDENIVSFNDRVWVLNEKTIRGTDNDEVNKSLREEADRSALDAFVRGLMGEQTRRHCRSNKPLNRSGQTAVNETGPYKITTDGSSEYRRGTKRYLRTHSEGERTAHSEAKAKAGLIRDGGTDAYTLDGTSSSPTLCQPPT